MKKLFFFLFFVPNLLIAQYFDIGVSGGVAYYLGDLNQTHFNPNSTSYNVGLNYRINFSDHYSSKSSISYSKVGAEDSKSSNAFNVDRNLNFTSNILEIAQTIEFNFMPFEVGNPDKAFSPYIFAGIAIFKFAPQAKYIDGTDYSLQYLGTEGQGSSFYQTKKYDLTEVSIPFGAGIKTNISKAVSLSLEWGMRKTFTDYIDDVGGNYADINNLANTETIYFADKSVSSSNKTGLQRGDSKPTDWYNITNITINFSFGKKARYSCFSHKNH